MAKTDSKAPQNRGEVQAPIGPDIQQRLNELAARYKALDAKNELLQKQIFELKENALQSKNWQAVIVDKGGQLLIVAKPGDTDGDGHVSLTEAIAAANKFIADKGLGNNYKASALPTW